MCSHVEISPQNFEAAMGPKLISSRRGMLIHLIKGGAERNHKFRMIEDFWGTIPDLRKSRLVRYRRGALFSV